MKEYSEVESRRGYERQRSTELEIHEPWHHEEMVAGYFPHTKFALGINQLLVISFKAVRKVERNSKPSTSYALTTKSTVRLCINKNAAMHTRSRA